MAAPARARAAEPAQQKAGQGRHDDQDNHDRSEQVIGRSFAHEPLDERPHQRCRDRGSGAVRPGDGEGKRAAHRDDGGADRRGYKGCGDAIGDPRRQRRGEDQRGKRQAVGHRHDAGDKAGKDVLGECREAAGYRAFVGSGCISDGHASEPFQVSTLIVLALLWRDSAGDA